MDWTHGWNRRLLDAAGENGSDDGQGGGSDKEPITAAQIEGLIARHGDAKAAIRVLADENHRYRETIREQKEKLDGGVVLKGDDAKAWDRYRELGKPDELEASLKAKTELEEREAQRVKDELVTKAAEAAGLNGAVLRNIRGVDELEFELRTERVDGKDVQVPFVKGGDAGDTAKRLEDHAKEAWADLLPALQATDGDSGGSGGSGGTRTFHSQSSRGKSAETGTVDVEKVIDRKRSESGYGSSL